MSELSKGETPTQKNGKGGIKLVVIGIIVVICILIGAIVVLAGKLNKATKEEPKEQKNVITAENVEEVVDEWIDESQNKKVPEYFTVVQNTEWTFPDGNTESTNASVENDAENETPVYFDVIVDETGETVYSSPILELGAKLEKFKLDKALGAGTYSCTIIYHLVDEEQNELTTVNVGTTITVLN
jgi:Na+-transporting NADH:ubiquinone oxidoreductase subunit NqrC